MCILLLLPHLFANICTARQRTKLRIIKSAPASLFHQPPAPASWQATNYHAHIGMARALLMTRGVRGASMWLRSTSARPRALLLARSEHRRVALLKVTVCTCIAAWAAADEVGSGAPAALIVAAALQPVARLRSCCGPTTADAIRRPMLSSLLLPLSCLLAGSFASAVSTGNGYNCLLHKRLLLR